MESSAVVDLGLTRAEFWQLTPRQFGRYFERHLDREYRADRRAAMIACYIANYAGKQRTNEAGILTVDDLVKPRAAVQDKPLPHFAPDDLVALVKDMWGDRKGNWGQLSDEERAALFPQTAGKVN